ncbi:hypothetical protein [Planotetraspora kaengkrachanensis]|uniref:hypothetical protein n=1 Tax=Planotetraspora kaengkrachanensis TaxID=575193 RepID=UPI00194472BA|nr:hypothetical protein [Planotetraspora kaengkrachanensis]
MRRHRAGSSSAGVVVAARLLALTTAALTLSGFVATPQASANGGKARQGSRVSFFPNEHGPVWNHNHGRHNQNAPAINSPTTVTGVQQVSSVSENTNTQSGFCKAGTKFCKISQKLFFRRR